MANSRETNLKKKTKQKLSKNNVTRAVAKKENKSKTDLKDSSAQGHKTQISGALNSLEQRINTYDTGDESE